MIPLSTASSFALIEAGLRQIDRSPDDLRAEFETDCDSGDINEGAAAFDALIQPFPATRSNEPIPQERIDEIDAMTTKELAAEFERLTDALDV